ncbi:hypothetical protein WKR88_02450 [Trinickia caryophylli]|uniref:Uncharacterized protein n=2 Tax=Trinickia caryophylli TaxID=28094 RepID=A0A1X7DVB0_TRICW|nr:hypothetical protein [Trinickia caryophylli]WQE11256.1 hypothetical protein U0034_16070 [Trinickia caryophylli]SMF22500.1 hypothetical protein SAMN06295900_10493 [Trinickia caryophylli]
MATWEPYVDNGEGATQLVVTLAGTHWGNWSPDQTSAVDEVAAWAPCDERVYPGCGQDQGIQIYCYVQAWMGSFPLGDTKSDGFPLNPTPV